MTGYVQVGGLQVAKVLYDFVNNEAIPGTGIVHDRSASRADSTRGHSPRSSARPPTESILGEPA